MRLRMNVTIPALMAAASLAACSASEEPRNDAVNPNLNADATAQTPGATSFTEDQARGHIENAGYADVSQLVKTDTGLWQGRATRGGETVMVSVDYRGAVATLPQSATLPAPAAGGLVAESADVQGTPASATMSQDPGAMPGATSEDARRTGDRG